MVAIAGDIIEAALAAAAADRSDVADISLDAIARRAGISRSTLYRRIGSREALNEAVRATGVAVAKRPDVRERAVVAAAALIQRGGLQALTLQAVAAEAGCSVPALHSQLGGRERLLAAVYERYSPLPELERLLDTDTLGFRARVRAIYAAAFDAASARPALFRALLADAVARPNDRRVQAFIGTYLPRLFNSVGRWLGSEIEAGRCRPLPLPLLLQLLAGPMMLHLATRDAFERVSGLAPPSRDEVIDQLTAAYCRAVALTDEEEAAGAATGADGADQRVRDG